MLLQPTAVGICVAIPFLMLIVTSIYVWNAFEDVSRLEREVSDLEGSAAIVEHEDEKREAFQTAYANADTNFLQTQIESMNFLGKERALLEALESYRTFEPVARRLDFLTKGKNQMLFEEVLRRKGVGLQEVEKRLVHGVSIDMDDLNALIAKLEHGACEDRPQLMITNFSLKRDGISDSREVYQVQMNVLTRECE